MKQITVVNFSDFSSIVFCVLKKTRFLLIKRDLLFVYFLQVPIAVESICVERKKIKVSCDKGNTQSRDFLLSLSLIKICFSLKRKKIILRGLGFKIYYSCESKILTFKLGFSHLVLLSLPKGIEIIKIGKNFILFSGFDVSILGNFVSRIQYLRYPDSYKGKGFWKKYEKRTLKIFKKK